MATRQKASLMLCQRGDAYIVTQATNTTEYAIGRSLTRKDVDSLARKSIAFTITGSAE